MGGQLQWWGVPGAMLVMTGVLLLGNRERGPAGSGGELVVPAPMTASGSSVAASDAAAVRRLRMPAAGLLGEALHLQLPSEFAGRRVDLTLWRRLDGARERTPWIEIRPRIGADAKLSMAGVVAGTYDVMVAVDGREVLSRESVVAPGSVELHRAPAAVAPR